MPELPTLGGIARRLPRRINQPQQQLPPSPQEEQGILSQIGGGVMSGLGMAGNLLDLPGSMARDVVGGLSTGNWQKYNLFDQLLTPLRFDNRVEGRDLLQNFGMRPNRETGISGWFKDPGEGARDLAGFGTELLLDPLSYLTFGASSLGKAGQVGKRAGLMPYLNRARLGGVQAGTMGQNLRNLLESGRFAGPRQLKQTSTLEDLIKLAPDQAAARTAAEEAATAMGHNIDDLMGETLGKQFGIGLPFGEPLATFNAPGGAGFSRGMDRLGNAISQTWPMRTLRGLFDTRVDNKFSRVGQQIGELGRDANRVAGPEARMRNVLDAEEFANLQDQFYQQYGGQLYPPDTNFHPHDIELAAPNTDVFRQAQEEWARQEYLRRFRQENPDWVQAAQSPTGDYTNIPGYDTTFESYFGSPQLSEGFGQTPGGQYFHESQGDFTDIEGLWDILRSQDHPSLARNMPRPSEARFRDAALEQLAAEGHPLPFQRGQVATLSNGQEALVVHPGRERSTVFTRNRDGITNTFEARNSDLNPLQGTPEEIAKRSQEAGQVYSRDLSSRLLRATTEYGSRAADGSFHGNAEEAFRRIAPELQQNPELLNQFNQAAEGLKNLRDTVYQQIQDMGGKAGMLDQDPEAMLMHYPRPTPYKIAKEIEGARGRTLPSSFGNMKARTPETRDLPFNVRDEILTNPRYRGPNAARNIEQDFGEFLNPNWGADETAFDPSLFESGASGQARHAEALASWARGKPHLNMTGDAIADHAAYMEKATTIRENLGALQDVMYRYASPEIDGIPIREAFEKAGMNPDAAMRSFANRHGKSLAEVTHLKVPEEFVNGAKEVTDYFNKGPEWQGRIANVVDGFNRWFKTYVTVPFPGFLMRNFTSGQHLNLATAMRTPADIGRYVSGMKEAKGLLERAREAFAAGRKPTGEDAQYLSEMYAHRVLDPHHLMGDVEVSTLASQTGNPLEGIVPGKATDFRSHAANAKTFVNENPLNVDLWDSMQSRTRLDPTGRPIAPAVDDLPLVSKIRQGARTVVEGGTAVNKQVEWYNRVPLYIYYRKKGYSAGQAAEEVIKRHFDYGNVTDFERRFAKKAFPFWTFSSRILPFVASELAQRPGGGIAQTIRASNRAAGGEDQPLPQYVRETTSIPLGKSPDGTARFITGLGLAHEDPFSFLGGQPTPGGLARSMGVEAVSRSNPLLKGPLEWLTGESFFQRGPMGGRELSDMDPTVGRLLVNLGLQKENPISGRAPEFGGGFTEHALANSPFARLLTTARTLTDKRKWENPTAFPGDALALNTLTGIKTSDISPAAQDAVLRDALQPLLMQELGGRAYTNVYIPDAAIEQAIKSGNYELAGKMQAAKRIMAMLRERAKNRKR